MLEDLRRQRDHPQPSTSNDREGGSCQKCGILCTHSGICARCLDLPYRRVCKRHIPTHCFDRPLEHICQCQACSRKRNKPRVSHAVDRVVTEVDIPTIETDLTFDLFINRNVELMGRTIERYRDGSIRVFARTDAAFSRETEAGTQHITAHFTSHPQHVASGQDFDFDQLPSDLDLAVHDFNARGSNFVLDAVIAFRLVITEYRSVAGSTSSQRRLASARKKPSSTSRTVTTTDVFSEPFCRVCIPRKPIPHLVLTTYSMRTL